MLETEMLEDLIIAAFQDAKTKAETAVQAKMQEVTGGLSFPQALSCRSDLSPFPRRSPREMNRGKSGHHEQQEVTGSEIERLIALLAALPGLGHRSARKAALNFLNDAPICCCLWPGTHRGWREDCRLPELRRHRQVSHARSVRMPGATPPLSSWWRRSVTCGPWSERGSSTRTIMCSADTCHHSMVSVPTSSISPALWSGRPPPVKEVLLALNSTVEGQSTAHYLTEQLQGHGVTVMRCRRACLSAVNWITSTKARWPQQSRVAALYRPGLPARDTALKHHQTWMHRPTSPAFCCEVARP